MEVVITRAVQAPATRVFNTVADIPAWPGILRVVKAINVLSGEPVEVGSHIRQTRKALGGPRDEDMYVAALDAPNRLLLTSDHHGIHFIGEFTVHSVDAETSNLSLRFRATPETWYARIAANLTGLIGAGAKRTLEKAMTDFKTAAERPGPAG